MNKDNEIKRDAVIASATEQFRSLIETHFKAIVKSAEDSFMDDDNQTEPKAKATISVEWDAISTAPKISVKIGWSVRFKDESEAEIDPLQTKLDIAGGDK